MGELSCLGRDMDWNRGVIVGPVKKDFETALVRLSQIPDQGWK